MMMITSCSGWPKTGLAPSRRPNQKMNRMTTCRWIRAMPSTWKSFSNKYVTSPCIWPFRSVYMHAISHQYLVGCPRFPLVIVAMQPAIKDINCDERRVKKPIFNSGLFNYESSENGMAMVWNSLFYNWHTHVLRR